MASPKSMIFMFSMGSSSCGRSLPSGREGEGEEERLVAMEVEERSCVFGLSMTMMFSGLRSRCMISRECKYSVASMTLPMMKAAMYSDSLFLLRTY